MYLFVGYLLMAIVNGCLARSENVSSAFSEYKLVPDILSEAPESIADVTLLSGAKVDLGNELSYRKVTQTFQQIENGESPSVTWNAKNGTNYTVMMFDVDAPTPQYPTDRSSLYWLVVNANQGDSASGEIVFDYTYNTIYAVPGGLHRIVILVYEQAQNIDVTKATDTVESGFSDDELNVLKFSPDTFAKEFHLGELTAGNFYRTSWDRFRD